MEELNAEFWLVDAVQHQKTSPSTFELPDEWSRKNVRVGEWAKLIFVFQGDREPLFERMWVRVVEVSPTAYRGVLDNEPSTSKCIAIGHRLSFEPKHIISIWPPRMYLEPLLTPPP
jgi:uncharacterized protein YegJ (DUF2314 family)